MTTIDIIVLTVFSLITLITVFLMAVFSVPRLYCYVFEHKDWKLWEEYINRVDEFEFDNDFYKSYQFNLPETDIQAHVWKEDEDDPRLNTITGYCSIHNKSECLCCTFDRYHSRKMADLLMAKIKTKNV